MLQEKGSRPVPCRHCAHCACLAGKLGHRVPPERCPFGDQKRKVICRAHRVNQCWPSLPRDICGRPWLSERQDTDAGSGVPGWGWGAQRSHSEKGNQRAADSLTPPRSLGLLRRGEGRLWWALRCTWDGVRSWEARQCGVWKQSISASRRVGALRQPCLQCGHWEMVTETLSGFPGLIRPPSS